MMQVRSVPYALASECELAAEDHYYASEVQPIQIPSTAFLN